MSKSIESKSRLSMPISQMGAWTFWADPYAVGLSAVDAAAIRDGTADPDQIDRAQLMGELAKRALMGAPVGVPFGRPS